MSVEGWSMGRCVAGLTFVCALVTTACWGGGDRDPATISLEDAQAALHRAEEHATSSDFNALCGMGGSVGICKEQLRSAGGPAGVPRDPPKVVSSYIVPTKKLRGGQTTGGRVLVLQGTNGLGRSYRTEYLVCYCGSREPFPLYPVYWSGIKINSWLHPKNHTTTQVDLSSTGCTPPLLPSLPNLPGERVAAALPWFTEVRTYGKTRS